MSLAAILLLWLMLALPHVISAQATTLEENAFWADLQTTYDLLQEGTSDRALSTARAMWQNIESVHLSDGTLIHVELTWLRSGLESTNPLELNRLRQTIDAILKYHQNHRAGDGRGSLAALSDILKDPKFRYAATATPQPSSSSPQQNTPEQAEGPAAISPLLAQVFLFIFGLAFVAILGVNFIRQLRIQRLALPEQSAEEDPTTSDDARDRAAGSEATQDYRTAIRFLYLASLLLLDERGVIHYDRTLTNREHLRQVGDNAALSDALRPVVNTFDRVWYGFATVNEAMYEQFRQDVERLRSIAP